MAFRSDGAPWIWDRLEWVIRRVGLKKEQVSRGLDWCHAVHHISLALALLVDGSRAQAGVQEIAEMAEGGIVAKGGRAN